MKKHFTKMQFRTSLMKFNGWEYQKKFNVNTKQTYYFAKPEGTIVWYKIDEDEWNRITLALAMSDDHKFDVSTKAVLERAHKKSLQTC